MNLNDKNIILTGAGGGLGRELALRLDRAGANIILVDINESLLTETQNSLQGENICVTADLTSVEGRQLIIDRTQKNFDTMDMLINCAGINPFGVYDEQDASIIQKTIEINMLAPMMLTHAVLPFMKQQSSGQIVNIGSTFGSIAFAWFTAYSASKFGLRGFSQALRRELAGSGIDVTYIAPRAVKTAMNSPEVYAMGKASKMNFDEPSLAADKIMAAIAARKKDVYIGFPESLFVRINSIAPGIVDGALKQQNADAKQFAVKTA